MKLILKIFGILLVVISLLILIGALGDLFSGRYEPGLMIGIIILTLGIAALGFVLFKKGNKKNTKAITDLQQGISMNKSLRNAARLMQAELFNESITAYTVIMDEDPLFSGVCHSQIGAAYYFLGRYQDAISHYELALENGADKGMMADNIKEAQQAMGKSTQEVSKAGNPIIRHKEVAPSQGQVAYADEERLLAHLDAELGKSKMVWHEIISDRIHIDIHWYPPSANHPFHILVTSGMSALPMTVPKDMEDSEMWKYAELCILLPPDWKLSEKDFKDEQNYWPVRLLKTLARLPHDYTTWLGWGHSVPNGDPPEPYARSTMLSGAVLIPPFALSKDSKSLSFFTVTGTPQIHIFQVLPVTNAEMKYKLDNGLDELLEKLESKIPDTYGPINPKRKTVC
ncbi:suppressor of fused domain protein [Myxococcota bacterium]|nr:suppressor of fused domain protein [Myxococcota bacterium]MBU1381038.1 suppressor of fused domain protein [Myxococcota bacterium]MBU1496040.1 suppressor of fused domain protein [Myxococcota bacterium]